jgi:hypothetical protein
MTPSLHSSLPPQGEPGSARVRPSLAGVTFDA